MLGWGCFQVFKRHSLNNVVQECRMQLTAVQIRFTYGLCHTGDRYVHDRQFRWTNINPLLLALYLMWPNSMLNRCRYTKNVWFTVNKDLWARARGFTNNFHEWRSYEWKSFHEWPKFVTHVKTIFYSLQVILCSEYTNLIKTIIDHSFRISSRCRPLLTWYCDITAKQI